MVRPAAAARAAATEGHPGESGPLTQFFGFVQFEFAGPLAVPDGRYLARSGADQGAESVLVVETLGAPAPPARRRRRPREAEPGAEPQALPLTRATSVRAQEPFDSPDEAGRWLAGALETEEAVDALVAEGIGLVNRALFAHAAASADPLGAELSPQRAVSVRIGYGAGEEVAAGRFAVAHDVDSRAPSSRRTRRDAELRPQERMAAVLGERERIDACEPLLLRARADLDAGRLREAALQLRVGLEALLIELQGALIDPNHDEDMATLTARRSEAGEAANQALRGDLDDQRRQSVVQLLETCERVLRRRRVLRG
jgi:hypothetical protein